MYADAELTAAQAAAERWARQYAADAPRRMSVLIAEYDRRGGLAMLAGELAVELDRARAELKAGAAVLDAAIAYADSTAEPTDTPHEDALLDAVNNFRDRHRPGPPPTP